MNTRNTRINYDVLRRQAANIADSLPQPADTEIVREIQGRIDDLVERANAVAAELEHDHEGVARQKLATAMVVGSKKAMQAARQALAEASVSAEFFATQLEIIALEIAATEAELEEAIEAGAEEAAAPWWERYEQLKAEALDFERQAQEMNFVAEQFRSRRSRVFTRKPARLSMMNGGPEPVHMIPVAAAAAAREGRCTYLETWRRALHVLDTGDGVEEAKPHTWPTGRIPEETVEEWRATASQQEAVETDHVDEPGTAAEDKS